MVMGLSKTARDATPVPQLQSAGESVNFPCRLTRSPLVEKGSYNYMITIYLN